MGYWRGFRTPWFGLLLAILAVIWIAGCSSSSDSSEAVDVVLGDSFEDCVDARGVNSTPEEIAEAALNAPIFDLASMRQQRVSDQIVGDGQYAVVLDQVVQQVFRDVPSGGDAAFARAFCQMRGWAPDLINGSFLTLSTGFGVPGSEVFGRTPHLLRGIGRHECSAAEQGGADWIEAQATLDAEVFEARADPAQYKQSLLAQIDDSPGLRRELAAAKREKILAASPESLVDRLQMTSSVGRLAIDYQCPHLQQ